MSVGAVSSHRECLEARVSNIVLQTKCNHLSLCHAQFELGKLYVRGYYGGVSRVLAYQYLRQVRGSHFDLFQTHWTLSFCPQLMSSSQKLFSLDVLRSQSQLTEQML